MVKRRYSFVEGEFVIEPFVHYVGRFIVLDDMNVLISVSRSGLHTLLIAVDTCSSDLSVVTVLEQNLVHDGPDTMKMYVYTLINGKAIDCQHRLLYIGKQR